MMRNTGRTAKDNRQVHKKMLRSEDRTNTQGDATEQGRELKYDVPRRRGVAVGGIAKGSGAQSLTWSRAVRLKG